MLPLDATVPTPQRAGVPLVVSLVAVAAMTILATPIATAARRILAVEATTPLDWVPHSYEPRRIYDEFARQFGGGDAVVLSWPGCELGCQALERLLEAATGPDAPRDAAGRPWFDGVTTGSVAVDNLAGPPLSLDPTVAVRRLRGVLVGPDGRTTCAVVAFSPAGMADRRRAVAWLEASVCRAAHIDRDALHMAGTVTDNVAVDGASTDALRSFALPAGIVILMLTWWSLGSLAYAAIVLAVSLWCVGFTFLTLDIWGDRMSPVLIVMPVLVLVLGVSAGIHLMNYLAAARTEGGADTVAVRALRLGWLPCCLSSGTTAIGLASLVVSELDPIRVFGFHAAIGVLATLATTFLVLPGIFERWPPRPRPAPPDGASIAGRVATAVTGRSRGIVAASFAAMCLAAVGLPGLRTSVRIDTLFTPESRVIRDYAWIESAVGPLVPIEVLVRFDADRGPPAAERLGLVRSIADRLGTLEPVSGVTSAATFLPDDDEPGGIRSAVRKAVAARRLARSLADAGDVSCIRNDAGAQVWRVTARLPALRDVDYGGFLDVVRQAVAPLVTAAGGPDRGITASCTGVMPLVHAIQKTLLRDLFTSFLSACVLITLVMMVVEGGVAAGLVAMVSNVFPMLLLFGLLGWSRTPLDIGCVMTASIALGMAIDGTLHFLGFFRRARDRGADQATAVREAFAHGAAAMTQSSLVCGLGILVFAASPFAPTARFAIVLAALVAAALAGDLVLLPAMLVGRAGRAFAPRPEPRDPDGRAAVLRRT